MLQVAGLVGPNFAGHSFHYEAVTTAAECSIEDSTIKSLGEMAQLHLSGLLTHAQGTLSHYFPYT